MICLDCQTRGFDVIPRHTSVISRQIVAIVHFTVRASSHSVRPTSSSGYQWVVVAQVLSARLSHVLCFSFKGVWHMPSLLIGHSWLWELRPLRRTQRDKQQATDPAGSCRRILNSLTVHESFPWWAAHVALFWCRTVTQSSLEELNFVRMHLSLFIK